MSAELAAKPSLPKASGAEAIDTSVTPPEWRNSAEAVRSLVKWVVTAFAAVGGVLFAKGFVTTPRLSWSDNTAQLIAAFVLGPLGLLGVAWLILEAVNLIRPMAFEIGTLPAEFKKGIREDPRRFLTDDANTLEEFEANFNRTRRVATQVNRMVQAIKTEASSAERDVDQKTVSLNLAQLHLQSVEKPPVANPQEVTEAKSAVSAATTQLEQAKERLDSLLSNREVLQNASVDLSARLKVYASVRQQLLDRAEYLQASTRLSFGSWSMVGGVLLAGVGGIGYQLSLATPEDSSAGTSPSAPVVAELIRSDSVAGKDLWALLSLTGCQGSPNSARISVILTSGKGTPTDPYQVSTIPTDTCDAKTFTVITPVARLEIPPTQTITYSPSPSESPSADR